MESNGIKFIYWFAYYNLDSPSVRYRAHYPLNFFRENFCLESYLVIPSYSLMGIYFFLKVYFSALFFRKPDSLIIIQRVQSTFIYATLLRVLVKWRKRDTVYDLDDADYLEKNPKTIYFFAKNCDKISAGSGEIKKHLGQFNPQVIHITSPVVNLNIIKGKRNPLFTIGWIGGYSWGHKESLAELVFPALKKLLFKFKLVLIGVTKKEDLTFIKEYFSQNRNITLEMPQGIDWNNEREIQMSIVNFDIGLATLLNHPVQLSKSGIKVKQYLSNGVPVISSDLPENNRFVINGKNGYLCSGIKEFTERINSFYTMNDDDYAEFSNNARQSIIHFDHHKYFLDLQKLKALS